MKLPIIITALFMVSTGFSQQQVAYDVQSYQTLGTKAPNTHYIGEAWLNGILHSADENGYNMTKATFRANSTLDWHFHQSQQVLIIVEGKGYYQERGKDPILMRVGDVITCKPSVEHWHSSSKDCDVTYLAIYGGAQPTTWTEVLTQEAYDEVAQQLGQ